MATEAERSAVDQGHTAESVHAPLPASAAAAAVAPPAHPAAIAASSIPVPLAPVSPPSLPHLRGVPAPGAAAPVALQALAALPPVQAAVRGPAQGKAVGAGPDSAHLLAPEAAPVQPVAQRHAESHSHGVTGGNAAVHRGRGSPRRIGPRIAEVAVVAPAPAPAHARAPPTPHGALAPNAPAYSQVRAPAADHAPPASTRPVSAAPYPPLPWIPPVPGTGFVGAGGGEARGAFVPPRQIVDVPSAPPPPARPDSAAAQFARLAQVPTATLAQLWRLVECQQALTLILVNSHFAILRSPGSTLGHHARADCLTAAAQFGFLLLPVLAAPTMGGVVSGTRRP
ncbi:unnamed protein product [Closterium sp. NIES-54]